MSTPDSPEQPPAPAGTVAEASESRIIEILLASYPQAAPAAAETHAHAAGSGVLLGMGDDAALLRFPGGRVLTTVDSLVEGQDFLREWPCGYRTTGRDVGFKSTAQNVSDINAMGGRSVGALVALSLPRDVELAWVQGYAQGVSDAARVLGADGFGIVGGDLSLAGEVTATMTVLGSPGEAVVTRSGAKAGDRIVVAGHHLGRADAALSLLNSTEPQDRVETWGDLERRVAEAMFRPLPPLSVGPEACRVLTSLMDVSDGLLRDASRIAAASGVALRLDPAAIDEEGARLSGWAGRHAGDAVRRVLLGGEDHLLLGTCPPHGPLPDGFRELGTVTDGQGVWLGERSLDAARGFDHFS
ncbi:thiamine-phosphate kinase [Galactobacter caseinivorans]|uniref:thiamine-phosphate kinase n=1 Tax=Galactobacter caseinivorans TaxID=2676123 RepID=UPI001314F8C1|nr:thiamine-phosphate kinase [Galactobacter caseinivorans]